MKEPISKVSGSLQLLLDVPVAIETAIDCFSSKRNIYDTVVGDFKYEM